LEVSGVTDNGIGDYFIRDVEEEVAEEDDDFLAQPVVVPVAPKVSQPAPAAAPMIPAAPQTEAGASAVEPDAATEPVAATEPAPAVESVAATEAGPQAALPVAPPTAVTPEPAATLPAEPAEQPAAPVAEPATPARPAAADTAPAEAATPRPSAIARDMTREERLAQALDELMIGSPDIQAAALVSLDGFTMASALPAGMQEDRVGAMSAAILALGERAAAELGKGRLSQVFIEGQDGYVLLMASGTRAVLTCLADAEAKLGLVLYDMRSAAESIGGIVG
jgi:predicted regulator of Ras-like GTPase activity (Roadblock/LC7/MglB family)